MNNECAKILSNLESELLDIKTSRKFAGVKTVKYSSSQNVSSGKYRITYETDDEEIFSAIYLQNNNIDKAMYVLAKTPVSDIQDIEVYISFGTEPLQIVSNIPVVSVEKISD